jgi:hypothetical protein
VGVLFRVALLVEGTKTFDGHRPSQFTCEDLTGPGVEDPTVPRSGLALLSGDGFQRQDPPESFVNGVPTTYRIDVDDLGEPGQDRDTFSITTATGYTASGPVTKGNIQI